MELQLLDTRSREREGNLEILSVFADHFTDSGQCRHIAAIGNVCDAALVLIVIVVIVVCSDVKEAIALQMDNLMYLEI